LIFSETLRCVSFHFRKQKLNEFNQRDMTLALTFALKDQFEDRLLQRHNIQQSFIPRMK
jgi:hypothetical protein